MSESSDLSKCDRRHSYRRERPVQTSPLFKWPAQPKVLLRWLFGFPGYLWPWAALFLGIAIVWWVYFTPDMHQMKHLSVDWVAALFARNLALLLMWVGAWHAWLYLRKAQGTEHKFNGRWLSTDDPTFLFGDQVWDNVFWTVCSAAPIWSAYEALTLWLQANDVAPTVSWQSHPIYCTLWVLLMPVWLEVHFYATHRLIHWAPLYRWVHYIHHKNVNVGPWSGLAMHPVEHVLLFSPVMLFWIVPAHPLHGIYLLLTFALSPALSHIGFERLILGKHVSFSVDDYMHYLHHKYLQVNYGGNVVPLDKWFGTFHDGSDEAQEAMKRRTRERARRSLATKVS